VLAELLSQLWREALRTDRGGELLQVRRAEAAKTQRRAPITSEEFAKPFGKVIRVLGASRDQGQDAVSVQTSQGEEHGVQRGSVCPLRVVDDDGHRTVLLEAAQQLDERCADGEELGAALDPRPEPVQLLVERYAGGARQLLGDSVGQELLLLLAVGEKDAQIAGLGEEPSQERRLAEAGGPLDKDRSGLARPDLLELAPQLGELLLPTDECAERTDRPAVTVQGDAPTSTDWETTLTRLARDG
jgi:hypothetical protein